MGRTYLAWADVDRLAKKLTNQLASVRFDHLVAVTRGGLVPACIISEQLDLRDIMVAAVKFYMGPGDTLSRPIFMQFPADSQLFGRQILIVDDVWDSGTTVMAVRNRVLAAGGHPTVAVLHYKPSGSKFKEKPDYFAEAVDGWIVYPWDPLALPLNAEK
jgi:hypoxanthine phosphoribosyltransferase